MGSPEGRTNPSLQNLRTENHHTSQWYVSEMNTLRPWFHLGRYISRYKQRKLLYIHCTTNHPLRSAVAAISHVICSLPRWYVPSVNALSYLSKTHICLIVTAPAIQLSFPIAFKSSATLNHLKAATNLFNDLQTLETALKKMVVG